MLPSLVARHDFWMAKVRLTGSDFKDLSGNGCLGRNLCTPNPGSLVKCSILGLSGVFSALQKRIVLVLSIPGKKCHMIIGRFGNDQLINKAWLMFAIIGDKSMPHIFEFFEVT
jgi:hypothetical protein